MGFLDDVLVSPFGIELVRNLRVTQGLLGTGQSRVLAIPDDPILIGLEFGAQVIGLTSLHPPRGSFTNRYRSTIF